MAVPSIPSTSITKFQQTNAPVGWTKITTYNDCALRVTSGTASTGGTRNFTSVLKDLSPTISTTVGTISSIVVNPAVADTKAHTHQGIISPPGGNYTFEPVFGASSTSIIFGAGGAFPGPTTATGGGAAHNHPNVTLTSPAPFVKFGSAYFAITYVDMIIAQRN